MLLRKGTKAIKNKIISRVLSQCLRFGLEPGDDAAHAEKAAARRQEKPIWPLNQGVKLGRAGISGGKKKHSRMCR